jgi:hypothetical protein
VMNDQFPIVYKGHKIYEEIKTVGYCRNPISGHSWSEQKVTGRFRISGGKMITRVFSSVKKAKEHIDFYSKYLNEDKNEN